VAFWVFVLKSARTIISINNVIEESKQPLVSVIMPCYKMGRRSRGNEWRVAGESIDCNRKKTI